MMSHSFDFYTIFTWGVKMGVVVKESFCFNEYSCLLIDSILSPFTARRGRRACKQWPFVLEVVCYKPDLPSRLCSSTPPLSRVFLCEDRSSQDQHLLDGKERDAASSSQGESEAACRQIKAHHSQVSCCTWLLSVLCVCLAILL